MRNQLFASSLVLVLGLACEASGDPPPAQPTSSARDPQPNSQLEPKPVTPQPSSQLTPIDRTKLAPPPSSQLTPIDRTKLAPPPPAKLVPLEREQYEALQRQLGQGAVVVKDLPPQLSALATACPELSTFAVEVVGNVAGEVAGGTKMELPIELLSGVAEIVVENEKDAICKFVIKRLEP